MLAQSPEHLYRTMFRFGKVYLADELQPCLRRSSPNFLKASSIEQAEMDRGTSE